MDMHKNTKLTPVLRKEIWEKYQTNQFTIAELARQYHVSRPTLYKVIERAKQSEFAPRKSTNKRYLSIKYGLKRLAKVEAKIERKLKQQAKRYNKSYPGELVHFDTKRLPLLKGEDKTKPRDYLFVAIDDYSRELYATILTDKTAHSASVFLQQVIEECPYTIDYTYSDNGKEYKGSSEHAFVKRCSENNIGQKFTRVNRPQTNGKAERVIRTLMEMWHQQHTFKNREDRLLCLNRFINFYNTVKPHKGIDNMTPYEKLLNYFNL